ncbi:MAG: F0F1 ATP synthase subunit A [Alphaproteobacteria bacterium]|nr:F0F1 ATP synthase subunit A [Alphaproteobacteria bacterium]
MEITSDSHVLWEGYGIRLNATVFFTWVVMAVLVVGSWLITRKLEATDAASRWRTALEVIVVTIEGQIAEMMPGEQRRFIPFVGTLFLFIAVSNLLLVVPGFSPPTASLSTTTALALCVLVSVPAFGVAERGVGGYLAQYLKPTILMLPFNVIGEFSRALALAIRLYGNIMSGVVIAAILLGVAPLLFPVVMDLLALLTGMIQAYIFAVLAMVYIASAVGPPKLRDIQPVESETLEEER